MTDAVAGQERRGSVAMIVAAGGAGTRLGADVPKALCRLAGVPLVVHAVRAASAAGCVDRVVVAAPPGAEQVFAETLGQQAPDQQPLEHETLERTRTRTTTAPVTVTPGGEERQESVAAALATLAADTGVVLVHDAARALAPPHLVADVVAAVRAGDDAVVPVLPVVDTVVEVDGDGWLAHTPDRSRLRAVQTPQGFRRSVLAGAHAAAVGDAAPATDDAGLVARSGVPVRTLPGDRRALKITTLEDLAFARTLAPG